MGFCVACRQPSSLVAGLIRAPLFERHWSVLLKEELGLDYRLDLTHHVEYTQEGFADEMQQASLEIVHQEVRWGEIWAELKPGEDIDGNA